MNRPLHCPLCGAEQVHPFHRDSRREFLRCEGCALVFVAPSYYLTPAEEKAEYDLHQNDIFDEGYRAFLSRLAVPLLERLPTGARGLDFGCGPGPALATMLTEAGCQMQLYDLFFHSEKGPLEKNYQFITATEVVEHLHDPGVELARLWELLEPGGYLGVMTKLVRDAEAFAGWHYKNDPTHVCFFSEQTWRWWSRLKGAELERFGADVMLLRKP
ncbi:MAG: class I SAM-dependent methyltransferase [Halioglobus sp.]